MKNRDGLENSNHWATPNWLYKQLDEEFHFNFDPCPLHHDMSKWNGLKVEWGTSTFCNPPYDRINKPRFIEKAYLEWQKGKTIVMLLPASTSTIHFHKYIYKQAEIRFLQGRIKFAGRRTNGEYTTTGSPKHDSMIVVFRAAE